MFTPNLKLPNVFELSYYANVVISVFALESIMGKVLNSFLDAF